MGPQRIYGNEKTDVNRKIISDFGKSVSRTDTLKQAAFIDSRGRL
jgi:hypothetical protein